MRSWLMNNLLSVYGAVVGTIALILSMLKFLLDLRKDSVRLRLNHRPHEHVRQNIEILATPREREWDGPNLLPAYLVTVTNPGAIPAHLADVGVICKDGTVQSALVSQSGNSNMLVAVGDAALEPIQPKSSRTFTVYERRGREPLHPKASFVRDRTGKERKKRFPAQ